MTDVVQFRSPTDPVRAPYRGPVSVWELVALAALFGVYVVTMAIVGDQGTFFINVAGPIVFSIILAAGAIPAAMRDPNMVWTPLFWFRIAALVYFGFGNVIPFIVNPASQSSLVAFFGQYQDLLTKLNAISALGTLITLGASYATYHLFYKNDRYAKLTALFGGNVQEPRSLLTIGSIFLVVGFFIKIVVVLPSQLGVNADVLPGSVASLAMLADAGVYMVAVWAWKYRPSMLVVPFFLAGIEMTLSLLEFNKSDVILPAMVLILAWMSKGITVRRMVISVGALAIIFATIVPFVNSGRNEIQRRYHSLGGAGVAERLEMASYYFQPSVNQDDDEQSGLLRFTYVSCATLALSLYDNGHPGGTLATLPAIFVPRALWPSKPDMTVIGKEFNYMATGSLESSISAGWVAEAYWDYGWMGLPIILIPVGIILQMWSNFSLSILRSGRWLYFPFCLLGMKIGASVDGFVVSSVMGPLVLALVAYAAVRAAELVYSRTMTNAAPIGAIRP